jgi:hypothetical protein
VLDLPSELRDRLLLDPEGFDEVLGSWLGAVEPRDYGAEQLEHALGYPWERPKRSYLLQDDLVSDVDAALIERHSAGRHPILAFGSNAAPSALIRKFAHFEDPYDREILVLAGDLHDFDVGAAATVAIYGAMPATIFASPDTKVRAAVLFATPAQATQLTWSELSYFFGHLTDVRFEVDEADVEVTEVIAYVNRFGAFAPDGDPIALAAVPARDRTVAALGQRELLDRVGRIAFGTDCEDVVRRVHESPGEVFRAVREHIRPLAVPFSATNWRPLSADAGGPGPA